MLSQWCLETWETIVPQELYLQENPGDGENHIFGDYLVNAQGEDVVAGTRTPKHVDSMKKELPKSYNQLVQTCNKLEKHYKRTSGYRIYSRTREILSFYKTRSAKNEWPQE